MSEDPNLEQLIREIYSTTKVLEERSSNILQQVQKTNGRVTGLEGRTDKIEQVQENLGVKVAAGVFVATTFVAIIINKLFQ
jgi:hypothetical protein